MTSFIGFGLVLGGLAWMVQILLLMKLIVRYGVNVGGFMGLSLYTIPMLIGIITPFIVFIAVMFVYNKSIESNEIVVMGASGMSPFQIAKPALKVAMIIVAAHYVLNVFITPKSQDLFYGAQWDLRYGLGHMKLRESAFNRLMNNVVIYVEQVNQKDLLGLIMRDGRNPNDERIISAKQGILVNTPNGLSIAMGMGSLSMMGKNGVVMGTFDDAQMDLEMSEAKESGIRARRLSTPELVKILGNLEEHHVRQRSKLVSEGASRFLSPLMSLIFVLIAMVCLLRTTMLRRSASFAGLYAAVLMIGAQTLFMTLSSAYATVASLYYLGAAQLALIMFLLWRLCK